jgi:transposase
MNENDARYLAPAAQEALRRRAVSAVNRGMSQGEAARVFGVSRQSVNTWSGAFRAKGAPGLKSGNRGRPRGTRLQPAQAKVIVRAVIGRCPDQMRFPFALWTRSAVVALIQRWFGVRVSIWTAGRYLAAWGLTPQKPCRRAYEQDPEAVRRWLAEEYLLIQREAKQEGARLYWGDEMGVRSDYQAGRSYGLRGRTPIIRGTGNRFSCNMISALTNRGELAFMIFKEKFRNPVFLRFLRRLVRHAGRKVYLIVDRHPVHRAKAVKQWLAKHSNQIKMFYLPSYSPELNPDEYLNNDVKTNSVGRTRPYDQPEMVGMLRSYMRRRQHQPRIVTKYFHHRDVLYAAA